MWLSLVPRVVDRFEAQSPRHSDNACTIQNQDSQIIGCPEQVKSHIVLHLNINYYNLCLYFQPPNVPKSIVASLSRRLERNMVALLKPLSNPRSFSDAKKPSSWLVNRPETITLSGVRLMECGTLETYVVKAQFVRIHSDRQVNI